MIKRKYWKRYLLAAVAGFVIVYAAWLMGHSSGINQQLLIDYTTSPLDTGIVSQSVSASGSLEPINLINVGTQATGQISKLYVDSNDTITKGQLLAKIDTSLIEAQIKQSEAQLANEISATHLAELNAARNKRLYEAGYIARAEWERLNQDAIRQRTSMEIAKAQLDRDKVNLNFAVVKSPVDGVVISREVSEGQTVQSSFEAPILFKIAQDLTKMQINISLQEGDIGNVKPGQAVKFMVDAYPSKEFSGQVSKVSINPNRPAAGAEGNVTYNMVVSVDNADRLLLPGMTANASIIIRQTEEVLRAPNVALRYSPPGKPNGGYVYVLRDEKPVGIPVKTGAADMSYTELIQTDLKAGDQVITEEIPRIREDKHDSAD